MSTLFINGRQASPDELQLSHFHGESVFTTLRSHRGRLIMWHHHWQRLTEHAAFFGFWLPPEDRVIDLLHAHINAADHKIRVIIAPSHHAITLEPYSPQAANIYQGVSIIKSSWQVHPVLGRYKTSNLLPYLCALKEAQTRGAFEALLTNHDGFVVDGARTSLLHYDGAKLVALAGGLDGCMRKFVMMTLGYHDQCFMRYHDLTGQLLLANSLMGLVPVSPIIYDEVFDMVELFRMDKDLSSIYGV